ncbi:helix-turn-helix domain-containing protein [Nocardia terpenica]|uniref:Helix-turn-helix domain-containing protein n=1 Tax=Nocardia terpenica TaxID=455432 RepID=A0A6G9YYG0_9NOCA|nr:helix-turn-helix transcriptional regulator [Nocardia terpenica]QIS18355.1 helix-turn-helix domain-containing protein [Nocardia terpenica]
MGQALRELDPQVSAAALFGAELRARRLACGRSLRELGQAVLVSGELLAKVEKAQRRPRPDLVQRLDAVLDARGALERLAAPLFTTADRPPARPPTLSPDSAEPRLRRVIDEVRAADHALASDRLAELTTFAGAAAAVDGSGLTAAAKLSLRRAVAEAQQLAGWMLFDRGDQPGAERMFTAARSAARQAGAADLVAYVLGPSAAYSNIWGGDPELGVERAYGSLAWARRSGNRRLAAFAAAVAARAHARLGEEELCRRMLGESESELNRHVATEPDPGWLSVFDEGTLVGYRGSCLFDLGKPREAIAELGREERAGSPLFVRNRIIWRLESAQAHLKLGELEPACAAIEKALDHAESGAVTPRVLRVFHAVDLRVRASRGVRGVAATSERLRDFIVANE